MGGADEDFGAAGAYGSGEGGVVVLAGGFEVQVAVDFAALGLGVDDEADFLRESDIDLALLVIDGDIAEMLAGDGDGGDVDAAVGVRDLGVAGDAVEGNVAAASAQNERADDLAGAEDVGVRIDFELAIETRERELGTVAAEAGGAAEMLKVRVAVELAFERDLAGDVGDIHLVAVAVDEDVAGDVVGGEGGVAMVDVGRDGSTDGFESNVAMVGGDVDGGADSGDRDVAVVGADGSFSALGDGD